MSVLFNKKTGLAIAASSMIASSAYALTSTFTITATFAEPFALAETTAMNFGTLLAGQAATYVMTSAGVVTASAGGAAWGAPTAFTGTVSNSSGVGPINIIVNNFVANGGSTPSAPTCNYNAGGAVSCAVAVTGLVSPTATGTKALLVGMTLTVDGTQADAAINSPTYDIVVGFD